MGEQAGHVVVDIFERDHDLPEAQGGEGAANTGGRSRWAVVVSCNSA